MSRRHLINTRAATHRRVYWRSAGATATAAEKRDAAVPQRDAIFIETRKQRADVRPRSPRSDAHQLVRLSLSVTFFFQSMID